MSDDVAELADLLIDFDNAEEVEKANERVAKSDDVHGTDEVECVVDIGKTAQPTDVLAPSAIGSVGQLQPTSAKKASSSSSSFDESSFKVADEKPSSAASSRKDTGTKKPLSRAQQLLQMNRNKQQIKVKEHKMTRDEQFDEFSKLYIDRKTGGQHIEKHVFAKAMQDKEIVQLKDVKVLQVEKMRSELIYKHPSVKGKNAVCFGILVGAVDNKRLQNNTIGSEWRIADLSEPQSIVVPLRMTGEAFHHWSSRASAHSVARTDALDDFSLRGDVKPKIAKGDIFAILNPHAMALGGEKFNDSKYVLNVQKSSQIIKLGSSVDVGYCQARAVSSATGVRGNEICGHPLNKYTNRTGMCYHHQQIMEKERLNKRGEASISLTASRTEQKKQELFKKLEKDVGKYNFSKKASDMVLIKTKEDKAKEEKKRHNELMTIQKERDMYWHGKLLGKRLDDGKYMQAKLAKKAGVAGSFTQVVDGMAPEMLRGIEKNATAITLGEDEIGEAPVAPTIEVGAVTTNASSGATTGASAIWERMKKKKELAKQQREQQPGNKAQPEGPLLKRAKLEAAVAELDGTKHLKERKLF